MAAARSMGPGGFLFQMTIEDVTISYSRCLHLSNRISYFGGQARDRLVGAACWPKSGSTGASGG